MGIKPRKRHETTRKQHVLMVLRRRPMRNQEICAEVGISPTNAGAILGALRRDGLVTSPSRGLWELTAKAQPVPRPAGLLDMPKLQVVDGGKNGKRKRGGMTQRIRDILAREPQLQITSEDMAVRVGCDAKAASTALSKLVKSGDAIYVRRKRGQSPAVFGGLAATPAAATPAGDDPVSEPRATRRSMRWQDKIKFLADYEGMTPDRFVDKLIRMHKRRGR